MASAFESVIRLNLSRYSPEAAKRKHIEIARRGLAEFMARQTARPMVDLYVDGRAATNEEEVRPFGVITYRFNRMREVLSFAIRAAEELSPYRSGRYRRAWFFMSEAGPFGLDQIPGSGTIFLVNDQPYARKVHTGAKGFEVPAGIVEKVRQRVRRRYGSVVETEVRFIGLSHAYTLKNGQRLTYPAVAFTPKVFH